MGLEDMRTQTPAELPPLHIRKQALIDALEEFSMDYLREVYRSLFNKPGLAKTKAALTDETAEALTFSSETEFRTWFFALPALTQQIVYHAAFIDFIPAAFFEKELGRPVIIQKPTMFRHNEWCFDQEYRLGFLPIRTHYEQPVVSLPLFLKNVLSTWLTPPRLINIHECSAPDNSASHSRIWDNSMAIADSFPLLCDKLVEMFGASKEVEWDKIIQEGFKRKDRSELAQTTGFLPFELGALYAPNSVDLAARFILCMYNFKPQRPDDSQEGIRNIVEAFFSKKSLYPQKWHAPDRNYLEFNLCLAYLNRTSGYYLDNTNSLPASRELFQQILFEIAKDGRRFDADKLAEHIRIRGNQFAFCDLKLEKTLKLKAEFLEIDNISYSCQYHNEFHPDGIMRYYLLVRPLFKAYCYLFAVLGLLEITQEAPSCYQYYQHKQFPISPYDSLKTVRITEFGRWCLGLKDQRPPKLSQEYYAIADKELFLVTIQGNSLEREVYLDKIGRRLGEYRWRISPDSFISGCSNKKQIEEQIERFKRLIDPAPAPHWEQMFKKSLDRAGLFTTSRSDMVVYDLPEDRELIRELLGNPELKTIVKRAEGHLLVVPFKEQRRFLALLNKHGIAHF